MAVFGIAELPTQAIECPDLIKVVEKSPKFIVICAVWFWPKSCLTIKVMLLVVRNHLIVR